VNAFIDDRRESRRAEARVEDFMVERCCWCGMVVGVRWCVGVVCRLSFVLSVNIFKKS
jgi:hypothetical protein